MREFTITARVFLPLERLTMLWVCGCDCLGCCKEGSCTET